jgi:predicted nucleic acid-binding Zn ribbon protein
MSDHSLAEIPALKPLDTALGGPVVGSPAAQCLVCSRPMRPRKGKVVCSSTCRWRRLRHRQHAELREGLLLRAQVDDLLQRLRAVNGPNRGGG